MSMTQEQALKLLEHPIYKWSMDWDEREDGLDYTEAIEIAIAALRHQIWEEQLWHDAKTDPPKTPGLYYGKKDDTNSMYACQYRDGVWVLDMYPQQKMEIVQWADYTAFARENEETALRPVSREQVEKGRWIFRPYKKMPWCTQAICSECGSVVENNSSLSQESGIKLFAESNPFCRRCGAPMTDEAVEIRLKELEVLKDGL